MSTPRLRAAARRRHDRHGRRQAQRTGTRDDEDGNGRYQSVGERRRRSPGRPGDESRDRDADDGGHENSRHLVGELLDRGAAALSVCHHLDDLAEHGVGADPSCLDDETAGTVDGGAGDLIALDLLDRDRLA